MAKFDVYLKLSPHQATAAPPLPYPRQGRVECKQAVAEVLLALVLQIAGCNIFIKLSQITNN